MAHLLSSGFYGFLCSSLKKGNKYVSSFVAGLSGWFISHDGNAEFNDVASREGIHSSLFVPGFMGTGYRIWKTEGLWCMEADKAVIRGTFTVFELLASKIRAIIGNLGITQACGKIKEVRYDENNYYITLEGDIMPFLADDFIRCQHLVDGYKAMKGYWVKVERINEKEKEIVIPKSEFEMVDGIGSLSTPAPGDDIVQFGNKTNKARQSAIYLHCDEGGTPRIDVLSGINSKSFEGCSRLNIGGLDGIVDNDFFDVVKNDFIRITGYGLRCENGYFKGTIVGKKGYLLRPDGSGYLAGGAIKWNWSEAKKKWIVEMGDVILTWNNLSDEVKENLKGKDAVTYELRPSVFSINVDQNGVPKEKFITVELYKTIGNGTPQLCTDKCSIYYTVYIGDQRASTSSVSNSVQIQTYLEQLGKVLPIDKVVIGANVGDKHVCSLTLTSVNDGFSSEWLLDWDNNKTLIGGEYIVSPKAFVGHRDSNGTLSGVAIGNKLAVINDNGNERTLSGLFGLKEGKLTFHIDTNGDARFTGLVMSPYRIISFGQTGTMLDIDTYSNFVFYTETESANGLILPHSINYNGATIKLCVIQPTDNDASLLLIFGSKDKSNEFIYDGYDSTTKCRGIGVHAGSTVILSGIPKKDNSGINWVVENYNGATISYIHTYMDCYPALPQERGWYKKLNQ